MFINEKDLITASLRLSLVRSKNKETTQIFMAIQSWRYYGWLQPNKISRDILARDGLILILISHTI